MAGDLITAKWRLDLGVVGDGGVRLLDFTDLLQGEPRLVRNGTPEEAVKAFRAPYQVNRPIYNVAHQLSVSRVVVCASDWAARQMVLEFTSSLPVGPADCTIYYQGAADAVTLAVTLQAALVRPGFSATTENDRFLCQFTIEGGALVLPPP
jgi:hypothetical protein